jgi:hypothetical protein
MDDSGSSTPEGGEQQDARVTFKPARLVLSTSTSGRMIATTTPGEGHVEVRVNGGKWKRLPTMATIRPLICNWLRCHPRAPRARRSVHRARSRSPGRRSSSDEDHEHEAVAAAFHALGVGSLERDDIESAIDAYCALHAERFTYSWERGA